MVVVVWFGECPSECDSFEDDELMMTFGFIVTF
jgi:hypothetical protein